MPLPLDADNDGAAIAIVVIAIAAAETLDSTTSVHAGLFETKRRVFPCFRTGSPVDATDSNKSHLLSSDRGAPRRRWRHDVCRIRT